MRRWIAVVFVVAALAAGLIAWAPWRSPAAGRLRSLDIYFTCNTTGRIEPCGCFTGQMGGLTRVSTALKAVTGSALKLEAGNAIAGTEDFHVMQYRHLLRAFAETGYHAVNLGRREAKLSAAALRSAAAGSPV